MQRIDRIKSTLFSDLDHVFATTLISLMDGKAGKTPEVDRTKLMADVTEFLKTYDVLGLWREAEEVLRREVVDNFVKKVRSLFVILCSFHSRVLPVRVPECAQRSPVTACPTHSSSRRVAFSCSASNSIILSTSDTIHAIHSFRL